MALQNGKLISSWSYQGQGLYRVELYGTGRRDEFGKHILGYRFYCNGEGVFQGEDFHISPMIEPDSFGAVADLLGFLSLRPGDTDDEFFSSYTKRQLRFVEKYGEDLSIIPSDWESEEGREYRGQYLAGFKKV